MFEGYKESTASGFRSDTLDVRTTTSSYDVNGNLIGINGNGDGQVAKSFINDTNGIILQQSTGNDVNAPSSLTRQIVSNGQVWGSYGFAQPSAALATPAGYFNNLPPGMVISATQFDASFQPINSGYPSASVGSYLVQTGDTLQSIAQSAYGDRQLWFVIAQANGLMSDADLKVGHSLTIPSRVGSVHNTADTFKPYDPSELIGDTTPTLPVPQNDDDGCGFLGQLIMIIVAVVVTVATGGIGGAILGSVASQVVGNVLGVVDGFSWKSVALAAITAGVGQGVDAAFGGAASGIGDTILRAVVKNAITQGIGVATGLQDSFDWRGVAAAGIGAGVGFKVGELIGDKFGNGVGGQIAKSTVTGFASGLASAAVRGGKISVGAIAADAFGNALGGYLGEQLKPQPMSTAGSDKYSAEEQQADARRENNRFSSAFYVNSVADEVQVTPAPMPLYEGDENGHLAIALPQYEGGHGHGDGSSRNPMYSLGGGSDSGLRLGGGLGLSHGGIRVNQVDSTAAITEEDAVGGLNDRNGLDLQSDQVTGGSNPSNPDRTVKVRSGQTLSGIAGTNDSDTLDRIAQYNGLRSRHEVRAGATLIIPSADVLAGVEVSGSVSQRGAAGGVYYANRQAQADAQMRSDAAARATNPDYGNEGRNNPGYVGSSGGASTSAGTSGQQQTLTGNYDSVVGQTWNAFKAQTRVNLDEVAVAGGGNGITMLASGIYAASEVGYGLIDAGLALGRVGANTYDSFKGGTLQNDFQQNVGKPLLNFAEGMLQADHVRVSVGAKLTKDGEPTGEDVKVMLGTDRVGLQYKNTKVDPDSFGIQNKGKSPLDSVVRTTYRWGDDGPTTEMMLEKNFPTPLKLDRTIGGVPLNLELVPGARQNISGNRIITPSLNLDLNVGKTQAVPFGFKFSIEMRKSGS